MPKYEIECKYNIGDEVYMRTDTDGIPCVIVGLEVYVDHVRYIVNHCGNELSCQVFELLPKPRLNGVKYN